MRISLIAAMDNNRVIGKDNDLPWKIPYDWNYVLKKTNGYPIIYGRKTLDSLVDGPLPNSRNIVLTRNQHLEMEKCEMVHSMEEVFHACQDEEEVFIFGGEEIYRMFLPYVNTMYLTKIDDEFEGDAFFPEIDYKEWKEVSKVKGIKNNENPYDYYFYIYRRVADHSANKATEEVISY